MTTQTATRTYIRYYLNGQPLDGWDEVDYDSIDAEAALANLTDAQPGDILRIVRYQDGEIIEEVEVAADGDDAS